MPIGLQVLHRGPQNSRLDVLVAFELDLADLDLRPFFDHERDAHRGGRNLPHFGADGGELAPVLGEQSFDGDFRFLDAGGIVLALDAEADFVLLKAVEDVAGRNRTQANVADFADGRLFLHLENQAPALGSLFPRNLDIFEVSRVPQRVEVALQCGGVVDVAGLGENAGLDRLGWDAAVAGDVDFGDDIALRPSQARSARKTSAAASPERHTTPLFGSKAVEMKEMASTRQRKGRSRSWAQQCSPDESEKESLRPQPLGCKKTVIIR